MSNGAEELEGQVALVTGSAKNIGRAINLALAEAGAKVVINAFTSGTEAEQLAAEINDAGGKVPASIAAAGNLVGRKGQPAEIAAMVRTLCGPAGRYVTGQTICVNGGMYF
jgi:NAD(P)-dependent dehydrogenase (short-subunit alcohol dehydrogenase family)